MKAETHTVGHLKNKGNFPVSRFPLINAIISAQQEGWLIPGSLHEDYLLVLHKATFSELFLQPGFDQYDALLDFLISCPQLPGYFHIYDAGPALIDICKLAGDRINIRIRDRVQLKYQKDTIALLQPPAGYMVQKIDADMFSSLQVFNLELDKKFWKSANDFLENGFGFVILDAFQQPVSICYSACVANNTAEIDVATLPEHQQKGLAKILVAAFTDHCIRNHITANWDCFKANEASLRTAQSIGFTEVYNYTFLSIFNVKSNENK